MLQSSVSSLLDQGHEYLDNDCYEAALEIFQQAEKADTNNMEVLHGLGLTYSLMQDYTSSVNYYKKALQIKPDSNLLLASRGIAYQKLKLSEQAEADFAKAADIQPQNSEDFRGRGLAFMRLSKYPEAIESYADAIKLSPNNHRIWHNKAHALSSSRQYEEALASLEEAIRIKPSYHQAWRDHGILLRALKKDEESLSSYDKALEIQPRDYKTLLHKGHALKKLERYSEALDSYSKALELNPNNAIIKASYSKALEKLIKKEKGLEINPIISSIDLQQQGDALKLKFQYKEALAKYNQALELEPHDSLIWSKRGDLLVELRRYKEAVNSYDKALFIDPDEPETWFKQGKAFSHSNSPKQAISCYKRATEINHDYAQAWNGLGNSLKGLGRYKEAVNVYNKAIDCIARIKKLNNYWRPFNNKGWALFEWLGYEQAISSWDSFLREHLQADKVIHKESFGVIHHSKGKVHYIYGRQQSDPRHYWREAKKSYESALKFLTFETYPEQHLEVIQDLVRVCRSLGQSQIVKELLHTGSDLLERLLQETSFDAKKIQLSQKFASFSQLRVDSLANSQDIKDRIQSVELAEERKNICLTWLRDGWLNKLYDSPKYEDIQKLLDDYTAIIYWHISPAAITTFILKYNQSPVILPVKAKVANFAYPPTIRQLQDFEVWMKAWKIDYQKYRRRTREFNSQSDRKQEAWFREMAVRLQTLSEILNIQEILPYLSNIKNLILVPHRDLHLLPLHALFPEELSIIYLPSAQIGLNLQFFSFDKKTSILNIENPRSDLNFASIESAVISLFYPDIAKIETKITTKNNVINALREELNCFHFAGHGYHNSNFPKKSALELANQELLTLEDIFGINLHGCSLVCLSACETGLTSKKDLLDEYVGLVSGFLAAGTCHVVSTLWTVHSEASALLMIDFHRRRREGQAEVTALSEAVRWLKNVTVEHLGAWYEDILSQLAYDEVMIRPFLETELDKLSIERQDVRLYEHPYYWAAFTITGRHF